MGKKSEIKMINSEAIRRAWLLSNLSASDMAARIGISVKQFYAITNGDVFNPMPKTIQGIAAAFGVSIAQVRGIDKTPWEENK